MPVLIMIPDMMPDTCDGAAGCARGSQVCRGTKPALMPNPAKNRRKIPGAGNAGSWNTAANWRKSIPAPRPPIKMKPVMRQTTPTCMDTR